MKYKFITGILLLALYSCKQESKVIDEIKNSVSESITEAQKLDFDRTKFENRAEELTYIREYLKQELPDKLLREQPKRLQDAQYYFISIGKDYTLRETAIKVLDTIKATQTIMHNVVKQELSLSATKELIKNTDLSNQKYSHTFDNDTESNTGNSNFINEIQELAKIYPNTKRDFSVYHTENYQSQDKQIRLNYKIEHIAINEMEVTDTTGFTTVDEFNNGSIDGTLVIFGINYSVKGEYVGEGSFEGIVYYISGGSYATVSWRYMYDNSISIQVETKDSRKDYELVFVSKSTPITTPNKN